MILTFELGGRVLRLEKKASADDYILIKHKAAVLRRNLLGWIEWVIANCELS